MTDHEKQLAVALRAAFGNSNMTVQSTTHSRDFYHALDWARERFMIEVARQTKYMTEYRLTKLGKATLWPTRARKVGRGVFQ